jgi:hypothetical protein
MAWPCENAPGESLERKRIGGGGPHRDIDSCGRRRRERCVRLAAGGNVGRRKYPFDEAKTQRYLAEGRGQGEGAAYMPWLQITDLPSLGRSHRPYSPRTGRVHHLLSDGEWKAFLKLEADPTVGEIREGFPLDGLLCHRIAQQFGYRPAFTTDGTPYVLTIDFLVTRVLGGRRSLHGHSFKYDVQELSKRDWELHGIAEECLRRSEVPFTFIDQTSFNEHFEKAYDSVRAWYDLKGIEGVDAQLVGLLGKALLQRICLGSRETLLAASRSIASCTRTSADAVFAIAKH